MKKELDKELYPDYVYPEFTPDPNEPFREPIAKLGKKITDRIPQKLGLKKITRNDPEYWGLAGVLTDEEAELAVKLGVRKPKTLAEIVKLSGLEEKKCEALLEEMSRKGLLEYNWENPKHEKQYVLPMYVPGCAEFFNMNANILDSNPEMGTFFEHMSRLPLEKITPFVPEGGAGIGMHVIPVEKAIEMENESVDLEHISHWLNKYEGKYAASPCSCRRSRLTHGEGCADDPEGWCIAVGDMADYVVETQKDGRYIDKAEALEILKAAEDNGFVHQITNIDGANKIFAICNCNVNVCYALRTSQLFNTPNMSRSAYVAKVEKANCVACGKCVEFCPAGAVKLGQKLCDKEGCEVTYPRIPLPSEQPWGEHMWSHNYRDVNRINCYDTGTAPCKTACPAHIAVQGYLKLAKEGRYDDALALIKKDNPLPAVCGHVCNRRCEDACTRGTVDEAVAIDEVKRFLAERDLNAETRYIPKKTIPSLKGGFDEKIAIIGAGPAGLSCAYYLALTGYKPTIFEKNEEPGGMLRYGIPSYKLEKDLLAAEIDVIRKLGVEIRCGVEIGKDITIEELREQGYKGFYVAIGCQRGRKPGITGENAKGTYAAVDFLREAGAKESFALEGDVVVVGGGNVAIDAARISSRCVDAKISMFCLEQRENMPASKEEIAEALEEGIELNCGWGPKEVLEEDGKVAGVVFKKCIRVLDEQGRFSPEYDEEQTVTIPCKHVIFSVGQAIEWGNMLDNLDLKRRSNGGALADKLTYQTSEPDIFVGGDVYTGPRFAIDAIAAGREGAISLHRYVHENCTLTIGRNRRDFVELDKNNISVESYDTSKRQIPAKADEKAQAATFRDLSHSLTEEQVKAETSRCLSCGASVVDPNKCIGCGVCTTKCVFDAIHLHREIPGASVMRASEDKLKYILPNMVKQSIKVKFAKKK
ncbi:MAG: FAD-dependent oxidoreductase [Oliverpabstia intestinalis]|mgnify:FL=1|uniref:FAD-dependent oxidoreductase n=1 Tax=Oliverpabstia intestinalis TaxID=2606633 RepID=A0A7X2P1I8_9FIRM|nr:MULTISPECIES: FAD-dependent oxidoreductase [Oliverpabstia]MCF2542102.1 FAD-dependent oxidoreductase [Blautia producta]MEE1179771.1 FAD-dependent oxidoreductase [Lachnospiraceae bacterium]MCI7525088.1 FAD-dependent oxidoreductase [Oliverpabstia sp.]MDY5790262.1 FAD-dependent oxidoreductase [Oliverpabstia intestinalis]MST65775.1 FAD-dependent oxidoreductase [Oliverpabstia intestinalis]